MTFLCVLKIIQRKKVFPTYTKYSFLNVFFTTWFYIVVKKEKNMILNLYNYKNIIDDENDEITYSFFFYLKRNL